MLREELLPKEQHELLRLQSSEQKSSFDCIQESNCGSLDSHREASEMNNSLKMQTILGGKTSNTLSFDQADHLIHDWSPEENDALFKLFEKWGSRWTKISQEIKGKSQNCVKNRFYGSLRKALRKMNRAVKSLTKKFKKQVKYESITRIIDASEGLFRLQSPLKEQSEYLSRKILNLAQRTEEEMPCSQAQQLIVEINKFNMATRSYKSKKKIKNPLNSSKKESSSLSSGSKVSKICVSRNTNKSSGESKESDRTKDFEKESQSDNGTADAQLLQSDAKIQIQTPGRGDEDLKFFNDDDYFERNFQEESVQELFTQIHSPLECELWI